MDDHLRLLLGERSSLLHVRLFRQSADQLHKARQHQRQRKRVLVLGLVRPEAEHERLQQKSLADELGCLEPVCFHKADDFDQGHLKLGPSWSLRFTVLERPQPEKQPQVARAALEPFRPSVIGHWRDRGVHRVHTVAVDVTGRLPRCWFRPSSTKLGSRELGGTVDGFTCSKLMQQYLLLMSRQFARRGHR